MATRASGAGSFTRPVTAAAIVRHRLLTMNAQGEVSHAGASDPVVGVSESNVPAEADGRPQGDAVGVASLNTDGLMQFEASGAIAVGAILGKAADGRVSGGGGLGWMNMTAGITTAGDNLTAVPVVP